MKVQADLQKALQLLITRSYALEARLMALEGRVLGSEGLSGEAAEAALQDLREDGETIAREMMPTWQMELARDAGVPSGWLSQLLAGASHSEDEAPPHHAPGTPGDGPHPQAPS